MQYRITRYGDSSFDLAYQDEEMMELIAKYIEQRKKSGVMYFTYYTLCRHILNKANEEKKLKNLEPHTYYESPVLSQTEYTRVSRLLWSFILGGKLFVDFSNHSYTAHYQNDTVIGII